MILICILLFSTLKRFEVFPIDVWVRRVMNELYIKNEDETKVNKKDIEKIAKEYKSKNINIDEIIIAIPTLEQKELEKILNSISSTGIKHKIVPGIFEIIRGNFSLKDIRRIEPSDLLGREEIGFDEKEIYDYYKNKIILVTGGGGSIGSELVRQLITLPVKKAIALEISESAIHSLIMSINLLENKDKFKYIISNVRDYIKIDKILKEYKPDIIFHAAAYKHLPFMEEYPEEAIKNNILATENIATLSIKNNIKNFVFISTDKAIRPTSLMGASKRICERMIISFSHEQNSTMFKITRFGNVLGSNGSVVPLFKQQIREGGPVTVTHPDIIRYFMTIPEAVSLVLQAGAYAQGGEIFILDMGEPVKILDLAENMIRLSGLVPGEDIEIKFTGLRPGEKLYEELLIDDDNKKETANKRIFIGQPIKIDEVEFDEKMKELEKATFSEDENIRLVVKKLVPEYTIQQINN